MKSKLVLLGLLVLGIVVVGGIILANSSNISSTSLPAAAAVATAVPATSNATAIPATPAATSTSTLPPDKQIYVDINNTIMADAKKYPTAVIPTNPLTPPPLLGYKPDPPATPRYGFIELNPPFKGEYAGTEEPAWRGFVNDQLTIVYSGSYSRNLEQGFVTVATGEIATKAYTQTEYPTSVKEGSLKITAINGFVLTLVTKKGTTLKFDIVARQFQIIRYAKEVFITLRMLLQTRKGVALGRSLPVITIMLNLLFLAACNSATPTLAQNTGTIAVAA